LGGQGKQDASRAASAPTGNLSPCFEDRFEVVLDEFTSRFGDATVFVNSPTRGSWDNGGAQEEDRVVTVEVMVGKFNEEWWADYRETLEARFVRQALVIRAFKITGV